MDALIDHDPAAGIALLDALEERGRDPRTLLDQAVEQLRARLVAGLADPGSERLRRLADAARRLAAIDPTRAGIGGLRLQLELALFAATPQRPAPVAHGRRRRPVRRERLPRPRRPRRPLPVRPPGPSAPPVATPRTRRRRRSTPDAEAASASGHGQRGATRPRTQRRAVDTGRTESRNRRGDGPDHAPSAPLPAADSAQPTDPALAELLAAWPTIVAQLSENPPTKPLITKCRPVAIDGSVVTLGFPEEQAFLKDAAERRKTVIEAGIGAVLGRDVGVRCVVANVEIVEAAPAQGDAAYVLAEARRIFADDLIDIGEVQLTARPAAPCAPGASGRLT